ncbi:hypothetical protein [Albidovulum sp.]|uniref:hypothetical protein n=1 Tax=Albidovulum sp. TaxID=1872424 RepID=UPI001D886696|nr:hypothetical protein [Paracoccaceae bacterium]MCC0046755.1 hypothetical protein [Defluviimonas sp.]HPE24968.1 hypothetical protein [Albidovulum sp.]MCB2132162.1 hypothetical protein [Paracoccaceae bacterium]MCB2138951.1 hypothetical protein [Paracoccaceae bacterium]
MIIIVAGLVLGAALGWIRARRRGGNSFDKWQYALVHAILFGIAGLFVTLMIDRMV